MVDIGDDVTYYSPSTGDSDRGGLQFGNSQAEFDYANEQAESAVMASLGFLDPRGVWAWAEVGKSFPVGGSGSEYCEVSLSTQLKGGRSAFVDAWSNIKVTYHLERLSASNGVEEIDNTEVFFEDSVIAELVTFNKSLNGSVSGTLEAGEVYWAYARVSTKAGAAYPGTSVSDAHQSGDTDGFLKFNSMHLDWDP